jgi:hypothetical protein
MWVDGSVKVSFSPSKVDEVIQCFENHLTAFKGMKAMINNPPKKCTGCRGAGQIMVRKGEGKEAAVCPKCKGSGLMNLIPPSVSQGPAAKAEPETPMLPQALHVPMAPMGAITPPAETVQRALIQDDVPPTVALPHQQLKPIDLDGDLMPKMQELMRKHGYKVVPLTKDDVADDLARLTAERNDSKTEPPSAPIEEDDEAPNSAPALSLEELAALGDQS